VPATRRSTDQLGNLDTTMRHDLFFLATGLLVALGAVSWSLHMRLLRRLRSHYAQAWTDLGMPTAWNGIASQGWSWALWGRGGNSYDAWLWKGLYRTLNDAELTNLGDKLQRLNWCVIASLYVWVACAWFSGFISGEW
jgi:hypothetical protein